MIGSHADWIVGAVSVGVALAVALLAWAAIDLGAGGMARYRAAYTERTSVGLRELFLFVDPARLWAAQVGAVVLAALLAWIVSGNPVAVLAAVAAVAWLPRMGLRVLRERRTTQLEQQLPDALLVLAGGMRAGSSLSQSLQQLVAETRAPLSQEFGVLLREQRLGVSLDDALDHLDQRAQMASVTLVVSAMRIATETGGQLAETLERASHTLRNKLAMEAKIRALTSQGKLQAWVVGALPLALMLALNKLEPVAMHPLFSTRMGWATLLVIATLECFGVLLMRKIVAIDV